MKTENLFKASLIATALASVLTACTIDLDLDDDEDDAEQPSQSESLTLKFSEVATPITTSAQQSILASREVEVNGQLQSIGYNRIMATGHEDSITGEIFGLSKNHMDQPIYFEDGSEYVCNGTNDGVGSGLDYNSLIHKNDKIYMVSQFECQIGSMYVQELAQDAETGALSPVEGTLEFISQKDEFGGWVHCAGQTTPWNSHLGSEEYEPSGALTVGEDGKTGSFYYDAIAPYWDGDLTKASPYYYGWTPEVIIEDNGDVTYHKHYSMGRFAHELAYVMPDNRTVYLSDDGTNVGLFMFVADQEKDLSAGTLYAVKWNQVSKENNGTANLEWVNLGHATNAEIREWVAKKPHLSDIFEVKKPVDGSCEDGYTSINAGSHECIKLQDINQDSVIDEKDEKIASRLETRRFAAYMGATTEFRKEEGITFNERDGKMYIAMSEVASGMNDASSNDTGGPNHIRVDSNACGVVYELNVSADSSIGSDYVAKDMQGLVAGISKSYPAGDKYEGNSCDVDSIASPDNVSYLADSNVLIIGEDTGSHNNNMIWSYDLDEGTLTRIFTTPLGAETTSPFWYKDINGFGYLTAVAQHPSGREADKESEIGYVGPFRFSMNDK
ncbi:PhoX family protein [Gayadomonas joobiniege]|uniref:PhoX family protein n=1 Tax=Gayadomonas joobiniege TaxID=1234606 RepID=UPI0003608838|nr:alkaline phosphatase PhoX [Gayadomonas joobiniege]